MFNYISQSETENFEAVMRRVGETLQGSENVERPRQAEGWKVYRAKEPGLNDSVLYVWFIDPTVPGADYAVSQILNEAFPTEVQTLYEQYSESFAAGQSLINLDEVVEF